VRRPRPDLGCSTTENENKTSHAVYSNDYFSPVTMMMDVLFNKKQKEL
jgi:hypothetical protein